LDEIIIETIKLLGIALSASLASGGIIMHFIKKHDRYLIWKGSSIGYQRG
jgi:hypothetical protein